MIKPVVVELLRICVLHSRKFFLNPPGFYHLGQENCIANDASRLFYLSDTAFLSHMSIVHPQLHSSWQISLLLPELLSCVISTLCRKPYKQSLLKMRDSRGCTSNGPTSVPPCQPILLSNIHPSLTLISSKSTATVSGTPITPIAGWTDLKKNRFLRHEGQLQLPTSWML